MERKEISQAVVKRLPRYYRYLGELMESGVERISSNELSERMKVTASQIRQDLNNFGGFGQQGYGYNVKYLYTEIAKILGIDQNHANFEKRGFVVKGLFDVNPRLEGVTVRGIEIRNIDCMPEFIKEHNIEIAALTIPKAKAIEMAEQAVACGVKAIWNFAHTDLNLSPEIIVENVHLSESLMRISYNIAKMERNNK